MGCYWISVCFPAHVFVRSKTVLASSTLDFDIEINCCSCNSCSYESKKIALTEPTIVCKF